MANNLLSSYVTPTQAATYHNLILTVIGTVATITLAELIKEKKEVPVRDLIVWAGVFGIVMAGTVYSITKTSK